MTHDFDISRLQGQWQVAATSSRGQAFAAGDPRFGRSGKADLEPEQTLPVFRELYDKGYFPRVPDGLPYFAPGLIGTRLAILFAAGVVPLLIFALLI